jgi:hypothetical protein
MAFYGFKSYISGYPQPLPLKFSPISLFPLFPAYFFIFRSGSP